MVGQHEHRRVKDVAIAPSVLPLVVYQRAAPGPDPASEIPSGLQHRTNCGSIVGVWGKGCSQMMRYARVTAISACFLVVVTAMSPLAQASSPMGAASPDEISRMAGTVTYRASPGTLWSWSEDPKWLCSLVPSCIEASRAPGTPETIRMQISLAGVGIPLPANLTTVPVSVVVSDRVAGSSLALSISVENALGDFRSKAKLTITPSGLDDARSRLTYKTLEASGSGITGSTVIRALTQSVQAQLDSSAAAYYEYVALAPVTTLAVRGLRTNAKTGRTPVQVTATTTFPAGFTPPTTSGTVRIFVNGQLRCTTFMTTSKANCMVKMPARKVSKVIAVLKGNLSSGTPVSVGGSGSIRAGGPR